MKCPKCGYNSFDHLQDCKKCGADLTDVRSRFNLRSIFFPGASAGPSPLPAAEKGRSLPAIDGSRSPLGPVPVPPAAAATPASDDAEAPARRAETAAEPFDDDPHAFTLESLLAELPAAEPEQAPAMSWAAASTVGPGGEEETGDPGVAAASAFPPLVDIPSPPAAVASDSLPELTPPAFPSLSPFPPSAVPLLHSAVAVAAEPEAEEEPIRISLDDFDALEPRGEIFPTFEAGADFPDLEKDSPLPEATADESSPLDAASPLPGEAEEQEDAVDESPVIVFFPAVKARLAASVSDLLIVTAVFALFLLAGEIAATPAALSPARPLTTALLDQAVPYFLVLFSLAFGYFTFFHFLLGQTPGKMLLRLRVETEAGAPVNFSRAFLRSTGGLLGLLTAGLGFLPALRPGGRALNDRLAGTRVVLADVPLAEPAGAVEADRN